MSSHIERARHLIHQSRYELAARELQQALGADPDDPTAHVLLAVCLTEQKKFDQAYGAARQAATLAPDQAYVQYALAFVRVRQGFLSEAEQAIHKALLLDPWDADYFALLAQIKYQQKKWQDSLEAAERGLQAEAGHIRCANLRAMALNQLGRGEEASRTLEDALAQDPENAFTHTNQGWTALQTGEAKKALEHFREALRLDPTNDWARAGMVESLKAQYFVYRLMLKYQFLMSRLSGRRQLWMLIGIFLVARIIPFLIFPYLLFAFLSWVSDPLSNLLLRLNRYGRLLLTKEEITASNFLGGVILAALVSTILFFLTASMAALLAALGSVMLIIPVAGSFGIEKPTPRRAMLIYTGVMGFLLIAMIIIALLGSVLYILLLPFFALGFMFFSWTANVINLLN